MPDLILTRDQVRQIDQRAIDDYEMPGVILMENAGRNAAQIIHQNYSHLPEKRVAIFCGPGNNGGDGFVIARHLHNAGWRVRIVLTVEQDNLRGDSLINFQIVSHMPIPIESISASDDLLDWAELVVDALLGTGFSDEVREPIASLIHRINAAGKLVIAVDTPSGLDCQTGHAAKATIRAETTITFVAVKSGLVEPAAQPFVGRIITAEIGVPIELVRVIAEKDVAG
jgi:NAD(P)H-hydrate epimerase